MTTISFKAEDELKEKPQLLAKRKGINVSAYIKMNNPNSPILKTHPLKGSMAGFRAFSVTGDYRVIFKMIDSNSIKLIDIGKYGGIYS